MKAEIAYYYPEPFWRSGYWVKNLLLFFDGIALLVPQYMHHRIYSDLEGEIAQPLLSAGKLHVLEPESLVDAETTQKLTQVLNQLIDSGELGRLAGPASEFPDISYSRVGGFGNRELADALIERLIEHGLAKPPRNQLSVSMHPLVRHVILVLLSQFLRATPVAGTTIQPVTDNPGLVRALSEMLAFPSLPSAGNVVAADLETVSADVSDIPLDEVLGFRNEHQAEHTLYARNIREFVRDLSMMSQEQRRQAEDDRRAEIAERAHKLRTVSRRAWKRPASFALTGLGAAWTMTTGDPVGALLGLGGALLGAGQPENAETGAFSYLFSTAKLM